jgi:hypothetical protein
MTVAGCTRLANRLTVGNLGYGDLKVSTKVRGTPHSDINMYITHTLQDGFIGGGVLPPKEGLVFVGQTGKCGPHFAGIRLRDGRDGHSINGLGEVQRGEGDGLAFGAEGITGNGVIELGNRTDIARVQLFNLELLSPTGDHQVTEALFLVL